MEEGYRRGCFKALPVSNQPKVQAYNPGSMNTLPVSCTIKTMVFIIQEIKKKKCWHLVEGQGSARQSKNKCYTIPGQSTLVLAPFSSPLEGAGPVCGCEDLKNGESGWPHITTSFIITIQGYKHHRPPKTKANNVFHAEELLVVTRLQLNILHYETRHHLLLSLAGFEVFLLGLL